MEHLDIQQQEVIQQPLFDIAVSPDGMTVWVHSADGSCVGRFSKTWGLDVHRTVTEQLAGASQCLHCTHTKPSQADWFEFCSFMQSHHGIAVARDLITFDSTNP